MSVKIGFIGTGGIARSHFRQLKQLDVTFVGLCDTDENRAKDAANDLGGKAFTDFRRMLDEVEMDACYVCVPPFVHGEIEKAVIERGVNLFVEKPVALTMELAHEIHEGIKNNGLIAAVGYHWRYMKTVEAAKEKFHNRKVGMMLGYWLGGMPQVGWWRRWDGSGGQAVEQTTHIFDLARYFGGEVKEVYAAHAQRFLHDEVENFDVDDVGTVILKFSNGAIANISSSCINGGHRVGLDVMAKDLMVQIGSGPTLHVRENGEMKSELYEGNAILEEDKAFVDAVKSADPSLIRSDYGNAVKTLEVTLAANKSADTGMPISI